LAEPFEVRETRGRLARVLPGQNKSSAIQEIEGLLARAERVSDVSSEAVADVASRHGVDLSKRCRTARLHLYRRFFEHCLIDHALSPEEGEDLRHLRAVLHLADAEARRIHDEIASQVYGSAVDRVLEDQVLDPDEEQFLEQLRAELAIPDDIANSLLAEGIQRARQRFFSHTAARSSVFLTSQEAPLQLVGASSESIQAAVDDALAQACRAVPRLHWIEVSKIRGEVIEGRVKEWQVELKAWLDPE
jgi:flavin-binding protein dodecin